MPQALPSRDQVRRLAFVVTLIGCAAPAASAFAQNKEADQEIVTSLQDFFSRTTAGEEVEGHQCKTERNFGKIIVIDFEAPDGTHKTCTAPNPEALEACGLKVIKCEDEHRPAAFERKGRASRFKFKYTFRAQCICDDKAAPARDARSRTRNVLSQATIVARLGIKRAVVRTHQVEVETAGEEKRFLHSRTSNRQSNRSQTLCRRPLQGILQRAVRSTSEMRV
jgi:hypothetical protein